MNVPSTMVAAITIASTLLEASTADVTLDLNLRATTRRNVEVRYPIRRFLFCLLFLALRKVGGCSRSLKFLLGIASMVRNGRIF